LGIKNTLNIVLDFQNCNFNRGIIQKLVNMNNNSFPCYLKHLYVLNIDIPSLMEDTESREILKSKEYKDTVLVLPEEYNDPLYKKI